MTHDIDSFYAL